MPIDVHASAEVKAALAEGLPVVALESTIITHGMPYPQNVRTALEVEVIVRAAGAVPATIAVLDGTLVAGVDAGTLERLATAKDAVKASRRDLAAVLARGGTAGTTVAATMAIAAAAGIRVFATGGIGGVHRGAEQTFDISADLLALGDTSVAVVCAGAKAILDIPKTLEYLETHGVPVVGYGTQRFPAFYTRDSGESLDIHVDTPQEAAAIIAGHRDLGFPGGVLIANPIPQADALDAARIAATIDAAVVEAAAKGIAHKQVTPFLLQRILEMTGGRSLDANIALVKNNAQVAARIAAALSARRSA